MTTNQQGSEQSQSVRDIPLFAASLDLPIDIEARVLEILKHEHEIILHVTNETKRLEHISELAELAYKISKAIFSPSVVLEKSLIEKTLSESWSQTCYETPNFILRPESSIQVSLALKLVNFLQVPFSIRSGGHSPNPGWNSVRHGLLIDFAKLNAMKISDDRRTVSVGPGATWGDVYQYLDPYDVTAIGGRVPQVGVGGLMLGGGISFFTGEYGLAADNVEDIEIVLADGSIAHANSQDNSDLFWALKGGGPNFGIVTQYRLRTVPIKNIWYQMQVHSPNDAPALFSAFASWQNSPDVKGSVVMIATLSSIILGLVYSAPMENPPCFEPFYGIEPMLTVIPSTIGTVLALSQISGANPSALPRHDYRGASSTIDPDLYLAVFETWKKEAAAAHETSGCNMTFVLQHIPKNVVDVGAARSGNPLGLEPISQQWWTTLLDWQDSAHDDVVRGAAIATSKKWEELGKARGSHLPFLYMNDASRDQNPLASYGSENLERLRRVARKYDPQSIFQCLQNNGFLLAKVDGW
ncbi:putative 6-hydroxy-D-nicotine oxidase [Dendryphion nanum]|uniref:6-hydroxy-D-nicotine oxidase n=1 Tax=Dendryphion nanum TaxID=256645 RepID=A0A9P9DE96_9PLEO|nr:putative 6-hydroxy-D-nicotine oxidase [Dendryphion nanum]